MIWHFFELWFLLLLALLAGCVLGTFLYRGLAASRLADHQGMVADAVGDFIDGVRARLGWTADWAPAGQTTFVRESRAPAPAGSPRPPHRGGRLEPPGAAEPLERLNPGRWATATEADDWPGNDDPWTEPGEAAEDAGAAPPPGEPASARRDDLPTMRPAGITAPRNGVPDDLQRIRGIGKRNEELLNSLGIFHFSQIAAWTPPEVRWVGTFLSFPERIERDDWIGQATILASGGDTGYVKGQRRRQRGDGDQDDG